jgi:non-ribosomal peptide synthase protein (TIGR01720 family)
MVSFENVDMAEIKKARVESQTGVEKALVAIWSQVLGVQSVGDRDNFFELGGDLSLARHLAEQIRTYLGIEIPSDAIIQNPTVKGLAGLLDSASRVVAKKTTPPHAQKIEYRASFAQVRLWLLYQLQPDSSAYNLCDVYRLHGKLNLKALDEALLALIGRHESLRTVFYEQQGELLQRIDETQLTSAFENLENYHGPEQESRLHHMIKGEAQRPFVLEVGPLFRSLLIALSPDLHVLVLTAHHIITDGWSQQIMISDLAHLYRAVSEGVPPTLPEMKMQYGNFAEWQREWLSGAEWERQSTYWKTQLAGAPSVLALPTDRPRSEATDSSPVGIYSFSLGEALSNQVRRLSLTNGTTLFMTLLAGFQLLLSRYSWQDDLCVGSPMTNRSRQETEELVGFFVNTLILRANLEDNPPFSRFLSRTRDVVLEALDHADMPFDQIVNMLRPERSLGSTPFVQATFALQNIPSRMPVDAELAFEHGTFATFTSKFDLGLALGEKTNEKQEITGHFSFNVQLFEQTTIERISRCYVALLNAATDDAVCPVFQLNILGDQERKLVMEEANHSVAFCRSESYQSSGVDEAGGTVIIVAPFDDPSSFPSARKSISHRQGYILDRFLQPVPHGAAGELYLAIESVALGDASGGHQRDSKFIENPFGPGTLYGTNQLVHNLSGGRIAVLGRVDERVKIRDQKIIGQLTRFKDMDSKPAPLTSVERILVEIWCRVLGVGKVGIHENFFEIGGNSLLAIRVATEARQRGLHFVGRDLFRYQTIGKLALEVKQYQAQRFEGREQTATHWPVTPIQHWLFEQNLGTPNVWNISLILSIERSVDETILKSAVYRLIHRHDALRLQFLQLKEKWVQFLAEADDPKTFQCLDLSNLSADDQATQLLQISTSLHQSFAFGSGLLVRFALIHLGSTRTRLLIIVHHLVCDGLSLQILVDDLATIYKSIAQNEPPSNESPQSSKFLDWAARLNSNMMLQHALAEQSYWSPKVPFKLPVDFADGENLMGSAEFFAAELEPEESAALVTIAREYYRTGIETILLWTIASTIMSWARQDSITLNLVGHGRETGWEDINLYRTIGWLNIHYPISFTFPHDLNPSDAIPLILHQLDHVPSHGIGFGVLRYLYNGAKQPIRLQEEPEFGFNYLGDYDAMFDANQMFKLSYENTGLGRDPRDKSSFKMGLFCSIRDKKIRFNWFFNRNCHYRKTIEALNQDSLRKMRLVLGAANHKV